MKIQVLNEKALSPKLVSFPRSELIRLTSGDRDLRKLDLYLKENYPNGFYPLYSNVEISGSLATGILRP